MPCQIDILKSEDLHNLCSRMLESDRSVRFVGIPWATRLYRAMEPALYLYTQTLRNGNVGYRIRSKNEYCKES